MKSVRLDPRTEARLRAAARLARIPESRIIRDAIVQRTDAMLASRLDYQLVDLIGVVDGERDEVGWAEWPHESFTQLLKKNARSERGRRTRSRS